MTSELKREYQIGAEIGRGRFGTVYSSTSADSGSAFAVKSIDKSVLTDPFDLACIHREAKLHQLASVSNPYAVNIHAVFEDSRHIHLVLDLCPNPDLFDRISTSAPFSEPAAASIISSLMESLAICHRRGIAHRDVKPENILFDGQDRLKLADFGSAEVFGDQKKMSGIVGTPYYVAPEVVERRDYDEKVDVWSAGVVLYVMLGGMVPFYGDTAVEVFEKVVRGNLRFPVGVFRDVSREGKDLIRRMVCKDVERRFTAEQVLRHPWITSGGGRTIADLANLGI